MNALSLHPFKVLLVCGLAAAACGSALAQEILSSGSSGPGAILIYGNFCGPGNRGPGYPPIDALDLACAHHDACSPGLASGRLPTCACNRRLQIESGLVARDARMSLGTRETTRFVSDLAAALPCQ